MGEAVRNCPTLRRRRGELQTPRFERGLTGEGKARERGEETTEQRDLSDVEGNRIVVRCHTHTHILAEIHCSVCGSSLKVGCPMHLLTHRPLCAFHGQYLSSILFSFPLVNHYYFIYFLRTPKNIFQSSKRYKRIPKQ